MHRPARIFADARGRRTVALAVVVAAVVMVGVSLALERHVSWLADPVALRSFVDGFGVLAPLAFVLLQAGQVIFAPIPGQVLGFASGWLFGAYWGTVYSLTGAAIGSYVAFRLARHYGRPFVERAIAASVLARFDSFSTHHGYLSLFVVFLIPGLPDDVICFVGGTTELDIKRMTLVSVVGRIPGYFLTNLAGAAVATNNYGIAIAIIAFMLVIAAVVYVRRDEFGGWLFPPAQ